MASYYWVGGTANMTAANVFATSSGGAGSATLSTITASDDVFFDNLSTGTATLPSSTTLTARSLDCTGFTGGITFAATTSVMTLGTSTVPASNIAVKFVAGMTLTLTGVGTINLVTTSSTQQTVTTGGKTLPNVTFNGSSTSSYLLSDDHNCNAFSHSAGTLDTGNKTINCTTFLPSGATTRTLTMGSSAINCSSSGNAINNSSTTNQTISSNTATITVANTTSGTLQFGSVNWNGTTFVLTQNAGQSAWTGAFTCATLTLASAAVKNAIVGLAANVTVTGTLSLNSNSDVNRLHLIATTPGTAISVSAATLAATGVVNFMDITGAGAATWTAGASGATNFGDGGGNSGITFATGSTQTFSSGTKNWSDVTVWTSRVPLPQDDVVVNTTTTTTLTADMIWLGKSVNFTSFNKTFTFGAGAQLSVFGSLTLSSSMTFTMSNTCTLTFRGRSSYTFTSAGITLSSSGNGGVNLTAPGGTITQQDALTINTSVTTGVTNGLTINNGTWVDNGFNLTGTHVSITGTGTRALTKTGAYTLGGVGVIWTAATTTGLTFSDSGSITLSTASATTRTFAGGGLQYNTLTYTVAGSTGSLGFTGSGNYFDTFNFSDVTNARSVSFTSGTMTTIKNFNVNGTSGKLMTVNAVTGGSAAYLELVGAVTTNDYLSVQDIFSTLPYKFYAGANSTNVSGNTNVTFTASVAQLYLYRQAEVSSSTNSLVNTFPFGQSATTGNMLILTYSATANPGTVTTPSGYTLIDSSISGTTAYTYTFYKVSTGGETSVTVATGNTVTGLSKLYEIGNFTGTATYDVASKNTTAGATSLSTDSGGTGPTNTGNPAMAIAVWQANNTMGATVSFSNSFQEQREATQQGTTRWAAKPLSSNAAVITTNTWTTSRLAASQLVVIKDVVAAATAKGSNLLLMGVG